MNEIASGLLEKVDWLISKALRGGRRLLGLPAVHRHLEFDLAGEQVNEWIRQVVQTGGPYLIGRLARIEMDAVVRCDNMERPGSFWSHLGRYLFHNSGPFWWDETYRSRAWNNAGFFPTDDQSLAHFARRMILDVGLVDLLGVYGDEIRLRPHLQKAKLVPLADLEPYYFAQPWSAALQGKRVLVIHPYEQSIRGQYENREGLHQNPQLLPDFELITLKAVQSIAGTQVEFASWFEALDWMCAQMERIDFDVALIGAGAYGLPLAAHARRLGRVGVHLGGALQILFGIRGRRWDQWAFFQRMYNEKWIRPRPEETPQNHERVERGAYW